MRALSRFSRLAARRASCRTPRLPGQSSAALARQLLNFAARRPRAGHPNPLAHRSVRWWPGLRSCSSDTTQPVAIPDLRFRWRDAQARHDCDKQIALAIEGAQKQEWEYFTETLEHLEGKEGAHHQTLFEALLLNCDLPTIRATFAELSKTPGAVEKLAGKKLEQGLHIAIRKGSADLLAFLIPWCPIDGKDQNGLTPIFASINAGQLDCLATLIDNQGLQDHVRDRCEWNGIRLHPLPFAIAKGSHRCVDLLLDLPELKIEHILVRPMGNLLHVAVHFRRVDILKYLLTRKWKECHGLLSIANGDGVTPLGLAAMLGDVESARVLCSKKADVNAGNPPNRPMDLAVKNGHRPMVEFLFSRGATITDVDSSLLEGQPQTLRSLVDALKRQQVANAYAPPNYVQDPPTNLVIQGGGPKGLGHIGPLRVFDERNLLDGIERICGTSAGAILGSLLAVDYSVQDLERLLTERSMLSLLDIGNPDDPEQIRRLQSQLMSIIHAAERSLGMGFAEALLSPVSSAELAWALGSKYGLASGDELEAWVEGLIAEKTKTKYTTLGEMADLIPKTPGFRHFTAYVSEIYPDRRPLCFGTEELTEKSRRIVLSSLVRASATFPGLFAPARLRIKEGTALTESSEIYLDGGMIRNFSLNHWDQAKAVVGRPLTEEQGIYKMGNPRTIGLSLYSSNANRPKTLDPKHQATVGDIVGGITSIYREAEKHLQEKWDLNRIIATDVRDVKISDFDLSPERQQALIERGERAAREFFGPADSSAGLFSPSSVPVDSNVPLASGHQVVFSQQLLERVEETLPIQSWKHGALTQVRAICGPPASGKSELAFHVARRNRDQLYFDFVIDCTSEGARIRSYRELSSRLGINTSRLEDSELESALFERLTHQHSNKPWLLIYDNVDQAVKFPQRGGFVICTSIRRRQWDSHQRFDLPFLSLPHQFQGLGDPRIAAKGAVIAGGKVALLPADHPITDSWNLFLGNIHSHSAYPSLHNLDIDLLCFLAQSGEISLGTKHADSYLPSSWLASWIDRRLDKGFKGAGVSLASDILANFADFGLLYEGKNGQVSLFPHVRLCVLSTDLGRASNPLALSSLLTESKKIRQQPPEWRVGMGDPAVTWSIRVDAFLDSPLASVEPIIRARLRLRQADIVHSLHQHDRALELASHALLTLQTVEDPEGRQSLLKELPPLWNLLTRVVTSLARYEDVPELLTEAITPQTTQPAPASYDQVYSWLGSFEKLIPAYRASLSKLIDSLPNRGAIDRQVDHFLREVVSALESSEPRFFLRKLFAGAPKKKYVNALRIAAGLRTVKGAPEKLSAYLQQLPKFLIEELRAMEDPIKFCSDAIADMRKKTVQYREFIASYRWKICQSLAKQERYSEAAHLGRQVYNLLNGIVKDKDELEPMSDMLAAWEQLAGHEVTPRLTAPNQDTASTE